MMSSLLLQLLCSWIPTSVGESVAAAAIAIAEPHDAVSEEEEYAQRFPPEPGQTDPSVTGAKATVESFVRNGFVVGAFFGILEPDWRSDDPTGNVEFGCSSPSLVLADAYDVVSVEAQGTSAGATVRFHVLGEVSNRELNLGPRGVRDVNLRLRYRFGRWWVLQPIRVHVGPAGMLSCLKREVAERSRWIGDGLHHAQREAMANRRRTIAILEQLVEEKTKAGKPLPGK